MTRNGSNGKATNALTRIARWLAVVGALNWGLVGIFDWDLVRAILGNDTGTSASAASRAVYALVGVAGVALAALAPPRRREEAATGRLADAVTRS